MPRRYVYQKIVGGGIPIKFEFLHGVSFAFYFEDPEGNVIEVFWPTGLEYPQPFAQNCEIDKRSIEAMGEVLAATNRSLIVAGGLGGLSAPSQIATENNVPSPDFPFPRVSDQTAMALLAKGVSSAVMRLPQVQNTVLARR